MKLFWALVIGCCVAPVPAYAARRFDHGFAGGREVHRTDAYYRWAALTPGGGVLLGLDRGGLLRYTPGGRVDGTFTPPSGLTPQAIGVDGRGRTLVIASTTTSVTVLRLLRDGHIDGSYGQNGLATISAARYDTYGSAVPVAPEVLLDGDAALVAWREPGQMVLARLGADGQVLERQTVVDTEANYGIDMLGTVAAPLLITIDDTLPGFRLITPDGRSLHTSIRAVSTAGRDVFGVRRDALGQHGELVRLSGSGAVRWRHRLPEQLDEDGTTLADGHGGVYLTGLDYGADTQGLVLHLRARGRLDRSFGQKGVLTLTPADGYGLFRGADLLRWGHRLLVIANTAEDPGDRQDTGRNRIFIRALKVR